MTGQHRYEIELDGDLDMSDYRASPAPEEVAERVVIKSTVTKKGRGFSTAGHFDGISQFDVLPVAPEDLSGRAQRSIEGWTIIVTGLHEECGEEDLADRFADYGTIKDLRMPLDHRTGYVKGYGLVEFGGYREAKEAVEAMNGTGQIQGQTIRCDFAFVRGPSGAQPISYEESGERRPAASQRDARGLLSRPDQRSVFFKR